MDTAVVWFRGDLRLTDNPTLSDAVEAADRILPVYVFDPRRRRESEYGPSKTASHRERFRLEAIEDLRSSFRDLGGELVLREGPPDGIVADLAKTVDADAVFAQTNPAAEERALEDDLERELRADIDFERRWTHTLYHPDDLPTPPASIDDTFTPWRQSVESGAEPPRPIAAPDSVDVFEGVAPGEIPTVKDLGVEAPTDDDRAVLRFEGGETAGKRRVAEYLWEGDYLREYKETRNGLLGANYSSKLSPWLAMGCLSPRWVHREVNRYEEARIANEDTYWLVFELLWRDFFQFQFRKHGEAFFRPGGIRDIDTDWTRDRATFRRWADGETGIPFVDANMRELNRSGYMSNRGRQNVASFLVDVLGVDWRWGAAYFESRLVDYDVASNWGNWAYQAGVGNDSRDRHFDVLSQGEYYDEEGAYVKTWLPELECLPPEYAHRPWRMSAKEQVGFGIELGVEYPEPIVDIEARYRELE
jgi:deoxyribodipyrimidine photo-lyase